MVAAMVPARVPTGACIGTVRWDEMGEVAQKARGDVGREEGPAVAGDVQRMVSSVAVVILLGGGLFFFTRSIVVAFTGDPETPFRAIWADNETDLPRELAVAVSSTLLVFVGTLTVAVVSLLRQLEGADDTTKSMRSGSDLVTLVAVATGALSVALTMDQLTSAPLRATGMVLVSLSLLTAIAAAGCRRLPTADERQHRQALLARRREAVGTFLGRKEDKERVRAAGRLLDARELVLPLALVLASSGTAALLARAAMPPAQVAFPALPAISVGVALATVVVPAYMRKVRLEGDRVGTFIDATLVVFSSTYLLLLVLVQGVLTPVAALLLLVGAVGPGAVYRWWVRLRRGGRDHLTLWWAIRYQRRLQAALSRSQEAAATARAAPSVDGSEQERCMEGEPAGKTSASNEPVEDEGRSPWSSVTISVRFSGRHRNRRPSSRR
ncbi:hypothetical protein [Pseudokineococcus sp. 1T1Z-3]|uniref:hypothetical protein n=1 Tax=Pseudokineococcus sp. 1T1Z-3 TaxID=3132745 RepID=UPI0030AA9403